MMELKKFDSDALNTEISNNIHSYIANGYHIDAKESIIDPVKDKDCTFKAVLKKDVGGIDCKSIITLHENKNDNSHTCKYHKVETVGDTKWSEETRSFSTNSVNFTKQKDCTEVPLIHNLKLNAVNNDNDKSDKNKVRSQFTVSKKNLKKIFNTKHKCNDYTTNDLKSTNSESKPKKEYYDEDLLNILRRIFCV